MEKQISHHLVVLFIGKSCEKLELADTTHSTACVLYHRFFQLCNHKAYDLYTIAATAIYLATKVEEQHVRLRDIVNVCHRTKHPDKPYLELDSEFWKLRDTIASAELLMMRVLQFQVTYIHPHKYMLHYLMSLSQMFGKRKWSRTSVCDVAWSILRDSYLSSSCLNFIPQIHAIAIIDLALKACKMKIPFSDSCDISWWKSLYDECSSNDIIQVQLTITEMYNHLDDFKSKN